MRFNRHLIIIELMLGCTLTAVAQVSFDQYREDGSRHVVSRQEVMYDNFFHAATFAVAATADAGGPVTFSLEVTFDEGRLQINKGDSLTLVLRGGDRVILTADRDVTRADVVKRHLAYDDSYHVTCHFAMNSRDMQRITRNRVTKLSFSTQSGMKFDRKLDGFQDRFRRQFTAVYRHLLGDSTR